MNFTPSLQWNDPSDQDPPVDLLDAAGGSTLVARALFRRGILHPQAARAFLDPRVYRPADPYDLPDLEKGVERVFRAIRSHQVIGVWGDFDVDGQTSTTLLVSVLSQLGAKVQYHIPVRSQESHGITVPYLKEFLDQGVELVLTCDTGITAHEAVDYANQRGVDMVITDHHSLPENLPAAFAAIDPQRLPIGHPLRTIPGVGTAFVFAQALCAGLNRPELAADQLDLVALGTVADVATLVGDARYQVQLGLQTLRKARRLGLQKIYELSELNPEHMSEEQIGFMIGPRMNALGRLSDANPIVEFLTTSDQGKAKEFAHQLEGLNFERRVLTSQIFQGALAQIERDPALLEKPALILDHPEWPAGVIGIVASRLVELYNRPVILLNSGPGGLVRGSARSIEGVNVTQAIASAASLLTGYGGHPMAAGMALKPENLPAFRRQVWADVEKQLGADLPVKEINIDASIDLAQISLDMVADIERLAPFGAGNPPVLLATRDLRILEANTMGKNADHLILVVEDRQGNSRRVVWWNSSTDLLPEGPFDLAYTLRANNYRGQAEVQLEWQFARALQAHIVAGSGGKTSLYEILDLRDQTDPSVVLAQIPAGAVIWAEGITVTGLEVSNRLAIQAADTLVIWNPPASREILLDVLQAAKPQKVILCAFQEPPDRPQAFLERLTGMVRYGLRNREGRLNLNALAAGSGQRIATIESGLNWIIARGYVRVLARQGSVWTLAEGGVPEHSVAGRLEQQINGQLAETASFRSFYRRTEPAGLLSVHFV